MWLVPGVVWDSGIDNYFTKIFYFNAMHTTDKKDVGLTFVDLHWSSCV